MNARDRIKQTATATGTYGINLDGGAAESGFLTFRDGFQIPSLAQFASTATYPTVPILVEVTSGASVGKWQVQYADLVRNGSDQVTLTSGATRICANSDQTEANILTPLAISNGDTVTVSTVPTAYDLLELRPRDTLTAAMNGVASLSSGNDLIRRTSNALVALGGGAQASGDSAIALGDKARAFGKASIAIGYDNSVSSGLPYGTVLGGYKGYCNFPFELASGVGDVHLLQAGTTPTDVYNFWSNGIQQVATTNATPTELQAHDPLAWVSGDTPTHSSNGLFCDSGLTVFKGTLTAVDVASGDMKAWDISFVVKTALDYSSTALLGTLTKTVMGADAGAAAWDMDVDLDAVNNEARVVVTGEAATEIVWLFNYHAHYCPVYV